MKVRLVQSEPSFEVTFKVIDKKARRSRKKSIIYDFKARLQTESITPEILNAISQAKTESLKHKVLAA